MKETFYHGGAPKLRVILPSCVTGAPTTADYGAAGVCRRDRVYITNSLAAATMFAACHPSGKGCVYRVHPVGELEPDPDFDPQGYDIASYQCEKAVVLEPIKLRPLQRQLFLRAFA